MAPRHTQGFGGAACLATEHPLCQQTKAWLVYFPARCLRRHPPNSIPSGFRVDTLSPHLCLNSGMNLKQPAQHRRGLGDLFWPRELGPPSGVGAVRAVEVAPSDGVSGCRM